MVSGQRINSCVHVAENVLSGRDNREAGRGREGALANAAAPVPKEEMIQRWAEIPMARKIK